MSHPFLCPCVSPYMCFGKRLAIQGGPGSDLAWNRAFESWVHHGIRLYKEYTKCRDSFFSEICSHQPRLPCSFDEMWRHDVEQCQVIEEVIMAHCGEPTTNHSIGGGPFGTDSFVPVYSYVDAWRRWTRVFPRDQIYTIIVEEFSQSSVGDELRRLRKFLGLPDLKPQVIEKNIHEMHTGLHRDDPLSCRHASAEVIETLKEVFTQQV